SEHPTLSGLLLGRPPEKDAAQGIVTVIARRLAMPRNPLESGQDLVDWPATRDKSILAPCAAPHRIVLIILHEIAELGIDDIDPAVRANRPQRLGDRPDQRRHSPRIADRAQCETERQNGLRAVGPIELGDELRNGRLADLRQLTNRLRPFL